MVKSVKFELKEDHQKLNILLYDRDFHSPMIFTK